MSKHTKGPWLVKEKPFCISVESEDDILSDLYLSDEDDAYAREHRAICYANARLIAAAPDLYESAISAQKLLRTLYHESKDRLTKSLIIERLNELDAAIKKSRTGA